MIFRSVAEFQEYSQLIVEVHPLLKGAFGAVDGLGIAAQVSADEEIENATYSGWKHEHLINNVLTFSPKGLNICHVNNVQIQLSDIINLMLGTLLHAVLNAPGSWHDAKVARALYEHLLNTASTPESGECSPSPLN